MRATRLSLTLAFGAALASVGSAAQSGAQSGAQYDPGLKHSRPEILPADAQRLLVLANQARAANGAGPLKWDPALAAAALEHCLRMAAEGPISHRYDGEPDLVDRAGHAGAHFSAIEENVASGTAPTDPLEFNEEWLHSPGHRANLLNREVDSVGIAVVVDHEVSYAVADYSRAVGVFTQAEVETSFASLLRSRGLSVMNDRRDARAYCAQTEGGRSPVFESQPRYRMIWQNPDATHLPQELVDQLTAGRYRQAEIGSCPPQGVVGQFTVYRVAVLLY
jgi:uncharacterized protein YkwD